MTCHLATELGLALTALFLIPHHEGSSTEYTYTVISIEYSTVVGFPGGSDNKESACSAGDPALLAGLERSPREWNGNPLQYSCLENLMDRGAWQAIVHRVAKRQM